MFKRVQDALIALLRARLPSKVTVTAHGGRFSDAELARLPTEAPAVKVAVLGCGKMQIQGGIAHAAMQAGLFVAATQSRGGTADESALTLVSAILPIIAGVPLDLDAVSAPAEIRAENLYSGQLNSQYCALWVVSFTAAVDLPLPADGALDAFVAVETTWGNTGATDYVTLPPHDSPDPLHPQLSGLSSGAPNIEKDMP